VVITGYLMDVATVLDLKRIMREAVKKKTIHAAVELRYGGLSTAMMKWSMCSMCRSVQSLIANLDKAGFGNETVWRNCFNGICTSDIMDTLEQGKPEIVDEMEGVGVWTLGYQRRCQA